jgi:hypothetical protein
MTMRSGTTIVISKAPALSSAITIDKTDKRRHVHEQNRIYRCLETKYFWNFEATIVFFLSIGVWL